MIKISGAPVPPQDPKLKVPAIGVAGVLPAGVERGDVAALRKELATTKAALEALTARVATLEASPEPQSNKPAVRLSNKSNKSNAESAAAFDKAAYQRELMRKRRAKAKAKA